MLVGYMRVSTDSDRQVLDLQRDALLAAGVDERHLFEDRASGSRGDRTGLAKALAFIKAGDCLVVWKLDRLGRSLPEGDRLPWHREFSRLRACSRRLRRAVHPHAQGEPIWVRTFETIEKLRQALLTFL